MKRLVDTILFDFWITLIEIDKIQIPIRKKYFSYFLAEKINITPERTKQAYQTADKIANNLRENHHKEIPGSQFISLFTNLLGIGDRFRTDLNKIYEESVLGMDLKLRKGTKEVLEALKPRYKIGLISNTSVGSVVRSLLKRFTIEDYFDTIVLSDEIGIRKPEPYIFHYALNKIGSYPEKTAFVGDRPELDVLGAKSCGIYSIFLGDLNDFPDDIPVPDLVIDDLSKLIDRI